MCSTGAPWRASPVTSILDHLGNLHGLLGLVFCKDQIKIKDPSKLDRQISVLLDKHLWLIFSADIKGDAYESLLEPDSDDNKGGAGKYFTPRPFVDGIVVGARLIGQSFSSDRYLQGRPAGAANLPASNPELATRVAAAASRWHRFGVSQPAADLLLDSASSVDPHISLAAARQQLPRLARERGLPLTELERLLRQFRECPIGLQAIEPVVNVLGFNLALDALSADPADRPQGR